MPISMRTRTTYSYTDSLLSMNVICIKNATKNATINGPTYPNHARRKKQQQQQQMKYNKIGSDAILFLEFSFDCIRMRYRSSMNF